MRGLAHLGENKVAQLWPRGMAVLNGQFDQTAVEEVPGDQPAADDATVRIVGRSLVARTVAGLARRFTLLGG